MNNPHQTTTQTFDGFGRLKTQNKPEQDAGTNTVYNYNLDNSISSMIDARGAITNYTYQATTGLLNQVSYSVPSGSTIPVTLSVNYTYNNLGMRTSMIDGLGNVGYVYNNLGQMESETRQFTDALPNAPQAGNSFKLEYSYTLNGQLKSLKDPYGQQINYGFDKVGRLNNVFGSTAFAGITNYADTPSYNARGVLKGLHYGNGVEMNITNFNDKLQATNFEVKKGTTSIIKKNYEFNADSSLRYSQDVNNPIFDRSYKYDFASRVTEAKTGAEARGGTEIHPEYLPYRQSYNYNVYNQLTQRNNRHWGVEYWYGQSNNLIYTYQNNRITSYGYTYDLDGRLLTDFPDNSTSTYDAKGEMVQILVPESSDIYRYNDGNRREVKRGKRVWEEGLPGEYAWTLPNISYYIRSSVLGNEVVSEVNGSGGKGITYVYAAGTKIAKQTFRWNSVNGGLVERLTFDHTDASGVSQRTTKLNGEVITVENTEESPAEFDGLGGNMGTSTPYIEITPFPEPNPYPDYIQTLDESPMMVNGQQVRATLDGMSISYGRAMHLLNFGAAIPAALAGYQNLPNFSFNSNGNGTFSFTVPKVFGIRANENGSWSPIYSKFSFHTFTWSFGSAMVGTSSFEDCKPGQPCPKPRPTPTPVPTPAKKPYPNCYTFYDLIYNNSDTKKRLNTLWDDTVSKATETLKGGSSEYREGGELGGVLFFDEAAYTTSFYGYSGYKPTKFGQVGSLPDNFLEQLKNFKATRTSNGESTRILLIIHTHPPDPNGSDGEAFSKRASFDDLSNITLSDYGGGNQFGIVIYGKGKFKVYGAGNDDDETLKRTCIKNKP